MNKKLKEMLELKLESLLNLPKPLKI